MEEGVTDFAVGEREILAENNDGVVKVIRRGWHLARARLTTGSADERRDLASERVVIAHNDSRQLFPTDM